MFVMGIIFACVALFYCFSFHRNFTDRGYVIGSDFINYWTAARLTLSHNMMILFDIDTYHQAQEKLLGHTIYNVYTWSYPLPLIFFIIWLGFLSYPVGLAAWLVLTYIPYAFAVAARRPQAWGLAALLALSPASFENIDCGQNGFLSGAFMIGGLRLLEKRPIWAGILFGCLSYKPQICILIPVALIAGRYWRALISTALTAGTLLGLSVLVFGLDAWQAYFEKIMPHMQSVLEIDPEASVKFIRMMPTGFMSARIMGASLSTAYMISGAMMMVSILAVVYAFKHCRNIDLRNALMLTAVFTASPYIFNYDMPILYGGIVSFVAAIGSQLKARDLALLSFLWFSPMLILILNNHHIPHYERTPIVPLAIAALLAIQLRAIYEEKRSPANGLTSSSRT